MNTTTENATNETTAPTLADLKAAAKEANKALSVAKKNHQKAQKEGTAPDVAKKAAADLKAAEKAAKQADAAVGKAVKAAEAAKAKAAKTPKAPKVGEDGQPVKSTDALKEAAKRYEHDKEHKTASGNVSVDNGDDLAKSLRGATLDAVYAKAAEVLEVPEKELRAKYAKLNVGMQRMNLGNRMRGVLNAK